MWQRERGEIGESEVCCGDAVTTAYVYTCICVYVFFEEEKENVWKGFCELACVCAGVQGQGKREGAKGEGHNALGEGDEICGARW